MLFLNQRNLAKLYFYNLGISSVCIELTCFHILSGNTFCSIGFVSTNALLWGRKKFRGLNPISEFYLHNLKKEKGKIIPRGFYHAAMTSEEMVDFDDWRQVQKGKSRDRFIYYHPGWKPW